MVVWQTRLRGSICSRTVKKFIFLFINGSIKYLTSLTRNQHIIKTSIPTSHAYISPVDRKTPNFVDQFECMSYFPPTHLHLTILS